MSLNYCEENMTVAEHLRDHCHHVVSKGRAKRNGTRDIVTKCCWCAQEATESVLVKHGPYAPGPNE